MLIYVYGSLKSGYKNNILLATSRFVDPADTKPKYRLYDCGMYPCMVKSDDGVSIHGEVYEINEETLKHLDQLEGVPYLYRRDTIELFGNFGEPVIAYFYQDDVSEFIDCGKSWPRKHR